MHSTADAMCGIGLIIAPVAHADAARAGLPALQAALQRRGPDAVRVHEWRTEVRRALHSLPLPTVS